MTYVELQCALDFFDRPGALTTSDFTKSFHVRGGDYVPFRQLCNNLGFQIDYAGPTDTITVLTERAEN